MRTVLAVTPDASFSAVPSPTLLNSDLSRSVATVGIVIMAPLLGGPAATTPGRQALLNGVLCVVDLVAAAWMLAQYALEVRQRAHCLDCDVCHGALVAYLVRTLGSTKHSKGVLCAHQAIM